MSIDHEPIGLAAQGHVGNVNDEYGEAAGLLGYECEVEVTLR